MKTKKVLVITYYWPPAAGSGVQRFLKFCKYFREFGWEPIVLTVNNGSYSAIDDTLERDIPDGLTVYKTKTFEPFSVYNKLRGKKGNTIPVALIGIKENKGWLHKLSLYLRANLFIPDARKGWKPFALKAVNNIMQNHKISVVITTGPPQSTHLIGQEIKKKYKLPWLADFRDPWTNVFYNRFFPRNKATERKDKILEDRVLMEADAVTVVSEGLVKEFGDRAQNIEVIYNGYDEDDFSDKSLSQTEKFTLGYIGNFIASQNIPLLWKAISELKEEVEGFNDNFRFELAGNIDSSIVHDVRNNFNLDSLLDIVGYLSHKEAVDRMLNINLLIFSIPKDKNNALIITGKLFEYIASRTPILSIGPVNGNAADILYKASRDQMLDYEDKDAIKNLLVKQYKTWVTNNKMRYIHPKSDLFKFSRKGLTRQLSLILNDLSK